MNNHGATRLPYIIIPELGDAKLLIDTGASESMIDPDIANLYFADYLIYYPFTIKTMHGNTFHRFIAKTPALISFKSNEKDFRWNVAKFSSKFSGLLGSSMLTKLNALVDYQNQMLHLPNISIPFYYDAPIQNTHHMLYDRDTLKIVRDNIKCKLQIDHLKEYERTPLVKLIHDYKDIIYNQEIALTFTSKIQHAIHLTDDIPIYQRPYRKSPQQKQEINKQIESMLAQDIIVPSASPYAAPVSLVPKKLDHSGIPKFRMVVDYRKLNDKTVGDKFPLPNITDILDHLGRAVYFSTLDLASGYHQIEIEEKDRHKTAFVTETGQYHFKRMAFGLKNAPSTFQRCMNHILADLLQDTCLVYLDDIIVYSVSLEEHLIKLRKVFDRLRDANLKISLDKCEFLKHSIKYLGHLVTDKGIMPDPEKIKAIKEIKLPQTQKQIKSFLGLIGYYRRFIPCFAKLTKPMTKCLKKKARIDINDTEYIDSFNACKEVLINPPLLQFPDFTKEFIITTDASNYAIAAVLSQGELGKDKPVCYASRTLSDTEVKYSTLEKEFLAIIYATKQFRPYIYGTKFTIITDHRPLMWMHRMKEPNAKLERWRMKMAEFEYEIKFKAGKINTNADALSRLEINNQSSSSMIGNDSSEDHSLHSNKNTENQHSIPISSSPINIQNDQIFIEDHNADLQFNREIIEKKNVYKVKVNKDKKAQDLILFMRTNLLKNKYFIFCNDEIYKLLCVIITQNFNNRIQLIRCIKQVTVITDKGEQLAIIKRVHEQNNHRGITEVFNEIRTLYYWTNYHNDIIQFVNRCEICQQNKYDRHPVKSKLQVTSKVDGPMQRIHCDVFKIKNKIFLTVIDAFSKYAQAIEILNKTAVQVSKALIKFFGNYGIPDQITFDNGQEFNNEVINELLKLHQINIHFTTPNNPKSNSEIERLHSTLVEHIRILKNDEDFMNLSIIYYNNSINTVTKRKPVELFFGRFKDVLGIINETITSDTVNEYKDKIRKLNEQIANTQQQHKENYINKANRKRATINLNVGQNVYIKFPGKYSKTNPLAKGPFKIVELLPNNKIKVKNKHGKNFEYHIDSIRSVVTD